MKNHSNSNNSASTVFSSKIEDFYNKPLVITHNEMKQLIKILHSKNEEL